MLWERNGDTINAEQQAEFVKVFSEIVKGRSLSDLEIYRLDVEYENISVEGEQAHVQTKLFIKNNPCRLNTLWASAEMSGAWTTLSWMV